MKTARIILAVAGGVLLAFLVVLGGFAALSFQKPRLVRVTPMYVPDLTLPADSAGTPADSTAHP